MSSRQGLVLGNIHAFVCFSWLALTQSQAAAVEREIQARTVVKGSVWHNVTCFVVPDPSNARVGSGGATFNALITVEDLLSGRDDIDLLSSKVFLIHSGGDSQRLPGQSVCGKAWSSFPVVNSHSQDLEVRCIRAASWDHVPFVSVCHHRRPSTCCWQHSCGCLRT